MLISVLIVTTFTTYILSLFCSLYCITDMPHFPNPSVYEWVLYPFLPRVIAAPILKLYMSRIFYLFNSNLLWYFLYLCHKMFTGEWMSISELEQWFLPWPPHCHIRGNCNKWARWSHCMADCTLFCFWLLDVDCDEWWLSFIIHCNVFICKVLGWAKLCVRWHHNLSCL